MATLKLVLKKKWFDMIAYGEKKEEYREITNYWSMRLYDCVSKRHRALCRDEIQRLHHQWITCDKCHLAKPKDFDGVMFYLGYAKDRPKMFCHIESISIGEGKKEWGAEKGKRYFVIKLKDD